MPTHISLIAFKRGCHFSETLESISSPVMFGVKIFICLLVGLKAIWSVLTTGSGKSWTTCEMIPVLATNKRLLSFTLSIDI